MKSRSSSGPGTSLLELGGDVNCCRGLFYSCRSGDCNGVIPIIGGNYRGRTSSGQQRGGLQGSLWIYMTGLIMTVDVDAGTEM